MPRVYPAAAVALNFRSVTIGLERPGEISVDVPAGVGLHRRLRGSPRWGGTFTIEKTKDPVLAGQVELFLNEMSAGYPFWCELPLKVNLFAPVVGTEGITPVTTGPNAGRFQLTAWREGMVTGQYVQVTLAVDSYADGRLHQFQYIDGNGVGDTTWRMGDASGKEAFVTLLPIIPYSNFRFVRPASIVRVYFPDPAPVYHERRGIAVPGRAIHGPWTVAWSEML